MNSILIVLLITLGVSTPAHAATKRPVARSPAQVEAEYQSRRAGAIALLQSELRGDLMLHQIHEEERIAHLEYSRDSIEGITRQAELNIRGIRERHIIETRMILLLAWENDEFKPKPTVPRAKGSSKHPRGKKKSHPIEIDCSSC